MRTGEECVMTLMQYLQSEDLGIPVFKGESKPANYVGEYMAVNHLPFDVPDYGVSSVILNLNIHVPSLPDGRPDYGRLSTLVKVVSSLFDGTNKTTSNMGVQLSDKLFYYISTQGGSPMRDTDNTYFKNLRIKTNFNNG